MVRNPKAQVMQSNGLRSQRCGTLATNEAGHMFDTHQKYRQNETKNMHSRCGELVLLGYLGWWSRCLLVENELTDIDCDSRERHRDSFLAVAGEGRERWWKHVACRGSHSQTEAVFEIRISQAEQCRYFGKNSARHRM